MTLTYTPIVMIERSQRPSTDSKMVTKVYVKSRGTDCKIGDNFYISQ